MERVVLQQRAAGLLRQFKIVAILASLITAILIFILIDNRSGLFSKTRSFFTERLPKTLLTANRAQLWRRL